MLSAFKKRRTRLGQMMAPNSALVLPGNTDCTRNGDTTFPFRQNSFFYHLTGFNEPHAWCVLRVQSGGVEFILFNEPENPTRVIWEGPMAGQLGAIEQYGADHSFPISELTSRLAELLSGCNTVYYDWGFDPLHDALLAPAMKSLQAQGRRGLHPPDTFLSAQALLSELRLFKDESEIELIQKAVDISTEAHLRALRTTRPGLFEYQLEAEIKHAFINRGARFEAYPSIVGSGPRTCYLHYTQNNALMKEGDLVLIDAGCEVDHYASDLTRTFPVNGRYSPEQKAIYECVLQAQLAGIQAIRPGQPWNGVQEAILKVLVSGLIELGLLYGPLEGAIEQETYKKFYMHSSGHWLGLDVHDVGRYKLDPDTWRPFEPGMVLTVEPGIYISADSRVHPKWHHIGIRIEDDVLVTLEGSRVLSAALPKTVADIEAAMKEARI